MPTLEELSRIGAVSAEKCVRDSRLLDYAWAKDQAEMSHGLEPHYLDDLIDRQFSELMGELDGSGNGT